ncbi:MAG: hypothetical protein PUP91_34255 [Rhizonema sp. PD37]|nr:hypothetical protein [Rhizonema sp. PD37]
MNQPSFNNVSTDQHNCRMGLGVWVVIFKLIATPQAFTFPNYGFARHGFLSKKLRSSKQNIARNLHLTVNV